MIISHLHKFIFIKTNKTAGTSLEIALSSICGKEDVITPISLEDEIVRFKLLGKKPQNFHLSNGKSFRAHSTASFIKENIPDPIWDSYYKFTIERNPWDKVISHFYWLNRVKNYPNIDAYIQDGGLDKIKAYNSYSIQGELAVNRIYQMEHFDELLTELTNRFELDPPLQLPKFKAKSSYRLDRSLPSEFLTKSQVDIIAEKFEKEIKLCGYSLK